MNHAQRVKKLYKSILRLHRGMPDELKALGDNYAKDEFKRHKDLKPDNQEVTIFMFEWTEYAINLAKQLGVGSILKRDPNNLGKDLTEESLDKFKDEQVVQLHELYKTAKGVDDGSPETSTSSKTL